MPWLRDPIALIGRNMITVLSETAHVGVKFSRDRCKEFCRAFYNTEQSMQTATQFKSIPRLPICSIGRRSERFPKALAETLN